MTEHIQFFFKPFKNIDNNINALYIIFNVFTLLHVILNNNNKIFGQK